MNVRLRKYKWSEQVKSEVIQLRKQGYTYGQLVEKFNISKSTLHQWVHGIERPKEFSKFDRVQWAKHIQPLGAMRKRQIRVEKMQLLQNTVEEKLNKISVTIEMKLAMLSMLYWAEGTKGRGMFVFANTDPNLMLLLVTLLRECFKLDESKFRVRLHLHWYHNELNAKKYWSDLLQVSLTQFEKSYRKQRSKGKRFRRNVGGICFLKYNSDYLREEIIRTGKYFGIRTLMHAPVA